MEAMAGHPLLLRVPLEAITPTAFPMGFQKGDWPNFIVF